MDAHRWGLLEAAAGQEFALPDNWTEGGREFVKVRCYEMHVSWRSNLLANHILNRKTNYGCLYAMLPQANMETAKKTQFNTLRVFAHAISVSICSTIAKLE